MTVLICVATPTPRYNSSYISNCNSFLTQSSLSAATAQLQAEFVNNVLQKNEVLCIKHVVNWYTADPVRPRGLKLKNTAALLLGLRI